MESGSSLEQKRVIVAICDIIVVLFSLLSWGHAEFSIPIHHDEGLQLKMSKCGDTHWPRI